MKSRNLVCSVVLSLLYLLTSCNPIEPKEEKISIDECTNLVAQYFPYTKNSEIQFSSENGDLISMFALESKYDGSCPVVVTDSLLGPETFSLVYTYFYVSSDIPETQNRIYSQMFFPYNGDTATIDWMITLQWEKDVYYDVCTRKIIPLKNPYISLTDTLEFPILYRLSKTESQYALNGAYVRIVRHKGLTEFCVDGETIWKRVK